MTFLKKILTYVLTLLVAVTLGLYLWFWGAPVGVNNYINKVSAQMVLRSPELLTTLGLIDNTLLDFHSNKLDSYDRESELAMQALLREGRDGLDNYGPEGLVGQELLSWKIFAWFLEDSIRQSEFEHGSYRVNQISGVMVDMPQFLTDSHHIVGEASLARYLSRLREFARVIAEVKVRVINDRDNGTIPPDFIIKKALVAMRAFVGEAAAENPLITTLPAKLETLSDMDTVAKEEMFQQAVAIVTQDILPQYAEMITLFEQLLPLSEGTAGIWRLPQGEQIYIAALRSNTSTSLTADEIHQLGHSEVARIEGEMETILSKEGFDSGSVVSRVRDLMLMPEHNFANTDEGRLQQIAYLNEINSKLMANVADYFITVPPQPLEIVRVPEYAQDSSAGGYYRQPALDGSMPGRFYINQKNTTDNPRWTLPTLMYHEGSPGHHFQLSAAQLIENVPLIRRSLPFNAFVEGWALYAERIVATDMHIYKGDALADLGRLQAEMFRAVRLVVDTGMHAKRWPREQAIHYMLAKTGMTEAEVTREIERYVVWPGQATGYKVGQLYILRLRAMAEQQLADRFDIKAFHEMILLNGAMPLEILEESVKSWIESVKRAR